MTRSMKFEVAVVALVLLLITPAHALAYVDPGTGSYLLQLALAGFLAGAYTVGRYWHSLKTAVRRLFERSRPDGDNPHPGPNGMV